jgi:hypothetical protein
MPAIRFARAVTVDNREPAGIPPGAELVDRISDLLAVRRRVSA